MRFAQTNRNRRRFLHDVPTVSYHPSSGRPGLPHSAPSGCPQGRHPDRLCPVIALYVVGLILLDGRQTQTTRGALPARPSSRCAQPAFESDAPLHESADGSACCLVQEEAPQRGLSLPGRRCGREGFRQEAAVGRLDLLLRQETQGLRAARGGAFVVRWRRGFSYPGGLPAVATQTLVRSGRIPHQAQALGRDAQGGYRLGAASRIHRLRHPLQRWMVHQDGQEAGPGVGRYAPSKNDRLLARQAALGARWASWPGSCL
jgi:hypothetical protein